MDKLINSTYDNTSIFTLEGQTISGKCVDIYDGDTMTLSVCISNKIYKFKMRLSGIDTPEIRPKKSNPNREEEKLAAIYVRNRVLQLIVKDDINLEKKYTKKEVRKILGENKNIVHLKCGKFDKFGRCLVKVFLNKEDLNDKTKSINKILINEKLAYKYYGKTKNSDFKSYYKVDL